MLKAEWIKKVKQCWWKEERMKAEAQLRLSTLFSHRFEIDLTSAWSTPQLHKGTSRNLSWRKPYWCSEGCGKGRMGTCLWCWGLTLPAFLQDTCACNAEHHNPSDYISCDPDGMQLQPKASSQPSSSISWSLMIFRGLPDLPHAHTEWTCFEVVGSETQLFRGMVSIRHCGALFFLYKTLMHIEFLAKGFIHLCLIVFSPLLLTLTSNPSPETENNIMWSWLISIRNKRSSV